MDSRFIYALASSNLRLHGGSVTSRSSSRLWARLNVQEESSQLAQHLTFSDMSGVLWQASSTVIAASSSILPRSEGSSEVIEVIITAATCTQMFWANSNLASCLSHIDHEHLFISPSITPVRIILYHFLHGPLPPNRV